MYIQLLHLSPFQFVSRSILLRPMQSFFPIGQLVRSARREQEAQDSSEHQAFGINANRNLQEARNIHQIET